MSVDISAWTISLADSFLGEYLEAEFLLVLFGPPPYHLAAYEYSLVVIVSHLQILLPLPSQSFSWHVWLLGCNYPSDALEDELEESTV